MNKRTDKQISILIPVYNHVCTALVESLHRQAEALGMEYEIIVADDGSDDISKTNANKAVGDIPHCQYIIREKNTGRAVIRNFLAKQAKFEWLIFLDCDIELPDRRFVERYRDSDSRDVVDGGIQTEGTEVLARENLRFKYERKSEPKHSVEERNKRPFNCFRTTNFMIRRSTMLANMFDERFIHYGYEDVLFGKRLKENGCEIKHINNPVTIKDFETNEVFVAKTEEALRTLYEFRAELRGFSNLLAIIDKMRRMIPMWTIILWHRLFGRMERRNLTGKRPSLKVFDIYRMGYYLSLTNKKLRQ